MRTILIKRLSIIFLCMTTSFIYSMEEKIIRQETILIKTMFLDRALISFKDIECLSQIDEMPFEVDKYMAYKTPNYLNYLISCRDQEYAHRLLAGINKKNISSIVMNIHPNYQRKIAGTYDFGQPLYYSTDSINFWSTMKQEGIINRSNHEGDEAPCAVLSVTNIDKKNSYFENEPNLYFIALMTVKKENGCVLPSRYLEGIDLPILVKDSSNNTKDHFAEIHMAHFLRCNNFVYNEDRYGNNPPQEVIQKGMEILEQYFSNNEVSGWTFAHNFMDILEQ